MELRGFSGNYSKKKWSYVVFLGIILKKKWSYVVSPGITGDTWLFRENVEKNEVLAFFHVLIQESECPFGISVTIA